MKVIVAFVALVALAAAIPLVPRDNSHYVEGESRYVWMPDGEGNPVLVDLEEPVDHAVLADPTRNGANNQYRLFTRQNPTAAQVLVHNNVNSVHNSNYRNTRGLVVIVHGWNGNANAPVNIMVRDAFLAVADVNVIVVDWNALANQGYSTAAAGVPNVGQHISK